MSTLSYQIGHLAGTICRKAVKALHSNDNAYRPDYDLLSNIPSITRRGIDLFAWHDANVKPWVPRLIVPTSLVDIDDWT